MTEGLRKMGADIDELVDGLIVRPSTLGKVHGFEDHRTIGSHSRTSGRGRNSDRHREVQ